MNADIDNDLVGVVPADLSNFLFTIKTVIANRLMQRIAAGVIGPYRTASGATRVINLSTDIQVFQSTSDPRSYGFSYFFNGLYPAKRFVGTFSVDAAFF